MKVSQLRALVAVAETGSFSEAALELGISQSSVSEALAGLENQLQSSLLQRGRFGARLTPLGEQVLVHARVALGALESIEQETTLARGDFQGKLRISTFRSIASQLIPPVMAQLKQKHPRLQLELLEFHNCDTAAMVQPLADGTGDLAFLPSCEDREYLHWKVMDDPYMALVPAGGPPMDRIRPEDLVDRPLILSRLGDCMDRVCEYLARYQLAPTEVIRVQDDFTMYNMVAQGLGVCLSPRLAIDYVPRGAVLLPLQEPLVRTISLAVRQGGLRTPAVRAFLQELRQLLPDSELPQLKMEEKGQIAPPV